MKFLLLLCLSVSAAFAGPREEAESHLLSLSETQSVIERLDTASAKFLGLPYGKGGPLGEGPEARFDQDPLYRFDTFDCTTFVETIISLALSQNADEFETNINKIRYQGGEVGYLTRNHYPSLQWVPNNVSNGLLEEINDEVLPTRRQKLAQAWVNIGGWLLKHKAEQLIVPNASSEEKELLLQELRDLAPLYPAKLAKLSYLDIGTLVKNPSLLSRIPHGSIVNMVRPNWDLTEAAGTHMNVSHQGFLFRKNKVLYFRHASTSGQVKEEVFLNYLKKFVNHPTLKGIHLMRVRN